MNRFLFAPDGTFLMSEDDFLSHTADLTDEHFGGGKEGWSSYSNANYVLAGGILRELNMQDLASLIHEQAFVPVGMSNSVMTDRDLLDRVARGGAIANGYRINNEKQIKRLMKNRYLGDETELASLSIRSTAEDLDKFLRSLVQAFDGDSTVSTEEEANKFFARQLDLQDGRRLDLGGIHGATDSLLPGCESMNRFLAPKAHGARRFGMMSDGRLCHVYHQTGLVDGYSAAVYLSLPFRTFVIVLGNGTGPVQVTDHIACGVLQKIVGLKPSVVFVKTVEKQWAEATRHLRAIEMADRLPGGQTAPVSQFVGVYKDPVSGQRIEINARGDVALQREIKRSSPTRMDMKGNKLLPSGDGFSLERSKTWEDLDFELQKVNAGTSLIDHTGRRYDKLSALQTRVSALTT